MDASPPFGMHLYDAIGFCGVLCYLGAYAALQAGLMKGETYGYAALNLLAASLVLISLTRDFNAASAAIQVSWIVISAVGIAAKTHRSRPLGRAMESDRKPRF